MRLKNAGTLALVISLVLALLAGCAGTSSNGGSGSADATDSFYSSNDVIEIVVPFGEGGGTDTVARLFQEYLPQHIEGNPKVQVINVPGAGGLNGTNQYALRDPDGYSLMASSTSVVMQYILGTKAMKFDYKTQVPLMAIPGPGVTLLSDEIYNGDPKELLDMEEGDLIYGSTAPNGASAKTVLMLEFLKLADKTTFVWGYDGTGKSWLAFQQGEINVHSTPVSKYLNTVKGEGITTPLSQIGPIDDSGKMQRHDEIPDIPNIIEVYSEMYGEDPSGPLYEAVKAISIVDSMSKALYMPKDAPEGAITAMKDAMKELANDEKFMNDVVKTLDTENVIVGDEADKLGENFDNIDEESLTHIRKLLAEEYGVEGLNY